MDRAARTIYTSRFFLVDVSGQKVIRSLSVNNLKNVPIVGPHTYLPVYAIYEASFIYKPENRILCFHRVATSYTNPLFKSILGFIE